MLNELEILRDEREIVGDQYSRIRARYLPWVQTRFEQQRERIPAEAGPPAVSSTPITRRSSPPPPSAPKAKREGPGWLAEQQANLLLYLGAFLIVIATLVFVGYSGQGSNSIDNRIKMALLSSYTLFFLLAGLFCLRFPRVRQAGVVFFALGSLMVPLDFVGAYGFFFAGQSSDPKALWLAGSISSALFYAATTYAGLGKWYAFPMIAAAFSSVIAMLALSNAPPEAYPGSFIALSLFLSMPHVLPLGKVSNAFGTAGEVLSNAVVPIALLIAAAMTLNNSGSTSEPTWVLSTRWFLPPTALAAAAFYWAQAIAVGRLRERLEQQLSVIALAVTGGALVTVVYAMDIGFQWYGPAVATLGFAYGLASIVTAKSAWPARKFLPWMALGSVTVAWLCFEGVYAGFPRQGSAVHFAAALLYMVVARRCGVNIPLIVTSPEGERKGSDIEGAVALTYAAALAFGIGVFELFSAVHHVGSAQPQDMAWTFLGVSLLIAAAAATMRWWWPELKPHLYAIALGTSLFVLYASMEAQGDVTLFLAVYAGASLALSLWEREPLGLGLSAAFGFAALLSAWRYYGPNDAFLPLSFSSIAATLFAAAAILPVAAQRTHRATPDRRWAEVLSAIALAYALAAPLAGGARLATLSDARGMIDGQHFYNTALFQMTALSVGLIGLAGIASRSWLESFRPAIYGVALAMSIGIVSASAGADGQVTVLLVSYGGLAFVLALWEREPSGLALPAAFGFTALLAAWRFYEPNDALLPFAISGTAGGLFVVSAGLPHAKQLLHRPALDARWAKALSAVAATYAVAAPIVGGVRLAILSDSQGVVGAEHFFDTRLFQMTAVSVGLTAIAGAMMRWRWPTLRALVYAIALTMGLGIVWASSPAVGQVTILLAGYGVLALTLTLWEREPLALTVPGSFGYLTLLAAWRFLEPTDAFLPLSLSAIGACLFAVAVATRGNESPTANRSWPTVLEALAFAYAIVAPVTGWVRLAMLAHNGGIVGGHHFEATALYQTTAASLALLAALVLLRASLSRRIEIAASATALIMIAVLLEIGHFRPENAQAYTAPLGAYLLIAALLSFRLRALPDDLKPFVPLVEVVGAALIMAPGFVQSLNNDAWRYGILLLVEGIGFISLGLVQRRVWLAGVSTLFVVMDGTHYMFFAGGPVIPNWAILALAGSAVMAAGTAILLGRDRWAAWQHTVQAWWYREQLCP